MNFSVPFSFFIFLCFIVNSIKAQEITINDAETGFPLSGALISTNDKSKFIITNEKGQAPLLFFENYNDVSIQMYGYVTTKIKLNEFLDKNIIVSLLVQQEYLEEVILSVARSKTSRKKIAEKVVVISSNKISNYNPSTGADLLKLSPGIRLQKSQGGGGSPVLRGFEANRVLIVIDGVRMNNAIYRTGHLQNSLTVDPHNIDRVEVIFGSSSVGYGSDALGGVIHYYTKSPIINSAKKIKTTFNTEFHSANKTSINNISTELSFKNWGSISSLSFSDFGDIRIGKKRTHLSDSWGLSPYYSNNTRTYFNPSQILNENSQIQKNTEYSQYDFFQKFSILLPSQNQLLLNFQYSSSSDIPRYDKLNEISNGSLKFSEWYYGPQKRLLFSPQLKIFPKKKFLEKGSIILAYQNVQESRITRSFSSLKRNNQEEYLNILSLNADFDFDLNDINSFSYGIEGTYNNLYSVGYSQNLILKNNNELVPGEIIDLDIRLPITSRYPSKGGTYQSLAAYVNWILDLNDKISLNAGFRLTRTFLKANWKESYNINALLSEVDMDSKALTETLALTYRPKENIQWSFMLSSGFRNPNIDDIGKIRESKGVLIVPNPFLKPEYAYNIEAGFTKFLKNTPNYISIRSYTTLISRHIIRSNYSIFSDTTTNDNSTIIYNGEELITEANKNLGDRYIFGGSIDGYYRFSKNLFSKASITITEGDKNSKYGPLPSISPLFGHFSLNYNTKLWNIIADFSFSESKNPEKYSHGGEDGLDETPVISYDFSENQIIYAGSPKWNDFSVLSNYTYSENIKLNFGISNILDSHYREFASGVSAPGRNFRLGLNIHF
jgi:hemoglobin/transferrin/lactoferrin receptor protein